MWINNIWSEEEQYCYKAVIVKEERGKIYKEKYCSIYDESEYRIGVRREQKVFPLHGGGYYAYRTMDEALKYAIDVKKFNPGSRIAILGVSCFGDYVEYKNGKIAFQNIIPIRREMHWCRVQAIYWEWRESKESPRSIKYSTTLYTAPSKGPADQESAGDTS